MAKPLRGVLVVALEQAVAAPLCTCRLADAGARVIKVERRGVGDFARHYDTMVNCADSTYFSWLNRGKESLELDIKDADDAALLRRIVDRADVFVQNLAPGAAARAGFGAAELRATNPDLITLDISGYGEGGDKADLKAYDLLVQAESGICAVTGTPDGPGRVGVSICDIAAGMNGYGAIVTALAGAGLAARGRQRHARGHRGAEHSSRGDGDEAGAESAADGDICGGAGASLHVSLFSTATELMAVPCLQSHYTGIAPSRVGLAHPSIAPYGAFQTREGRDVLISIQNEREWVALCTVLGRPAMASASQFTTPSLRLEHRAELDAELQRLISTWGHDALCDALQNAGVAFGAVNDVQSVLEHPQLRTTTYAAPSGDVTCVAHPVSAASHISMPECTGGDGGSEHIYGPVPALGEHTDAIRAEFST